MDDTIRKAAKEEFPEKGVFIAKHQTVLNNIHNYGKEGRIFVTDQSFIDISKMNDISYLKQLEAKIGLGVGTISGGQEIILIKIDNIQSKFIADGIPTAAHSTSDLFFPGKGVTVGGIPERVIPNMDISGYYDSNLIFKPR